MFTSDAAKIIGITPKALRAFLRTRAQGVGSGAHYEFSHDEVAQIEREYWESQSSKKTKMKPWLGDGGRAPLPHEWLGDPDKEAVFLAERKARLERMSARLRECGMDVPQMTEAMLKLNCRALASALLKGSSEDE